MSKKIEYKLEIPLFTDEATAIWKEMPQLIHDIVERKKDAISKFNRLDAIVNGGELIQIGTVFGNDIYTRLNTNDSDMAAYKAKRLGTMMSNFLSGNTEEIVLDGKRYTVVLKEDLLGDGDE